MPSFPINPTNGMIFESTPGMFYQFSSSTQSWYKIARPSIPVATEFEDGLMSSSDFNKIMGLIIPPPDIDLGTEDCATRYNRGLLAIEGDDTGIIQVEVDPEQLHENTSVINFKLDTEKFAQRMIGLGRLSLSAPKGADGDPGDAGDDGDNALPVGPQGED
jgi:hypothetical protein